MKTEWLINTVNGVGGAVVIGGERKGEGKYLCTTLQKSSWRPCIAPLEAGERKKDEISTCSILTSHEKSRH